MTTASPARSYAKHIDHEGQQTRLPSSYVDPRSIDAWRHRRMLELALPLLEEYPGARWMTVGDGNYGSDAHFLQSRGATTLATSISASTLQVAQSRGFIREFQVENAESLSAADESFDFVLCKESYHHFPRPPVAFYEMLRVAKVAVVLIEPTEGPTRPLDYVKTVVKKAIRKGDSGLFETSGNFVYRLSVREMEKMMTALNYRCVADKPFNDFYHSKLSGGDYRRLSARTLATRLGILVQDALSCSHLMNHGLTSLIALKANPSEGLRARLRRAGYRIGLLPVNPYW